MSKPLNFENLSPEIILESVEEALDCQLTGLAHPHTSYINRVYELQTMAGERLIAKFYRPGRWTKAALEEEHDFVLACDAADIPVIAPIPLKNNHTLGEAEDIYFSVYPKKWGRQLELNDEEAWLRVGRIMGRVHLIGQQQESKHRLNMHPNIMTRANIEALKTFMDPSLASEFNDLSSEILEIIIPLFEDKEFIRIHGDCHQANILERDEGLMLIDFDDMLMGPPVQDLWMLLPGDSNEGRTELNLIIEGYEEIRQFDWFSTKLVEPLRIMRILYFLSWCTMQHDDANFRVNFPEWGSYNYWNREINDLRQQLQKIKDDNNTSDGAMSIYPDYL